MSTTASILVVDDEPSMRRYLRTLLQLDSYQVETAQNGSEALERLQRNPPPDVVLLDLLMPGLDGLQTLERLRQLRPQQKVVMLSCVSDTRKVTQAIRLGAQDYLAKPFQKRELDEVLEHCLSTLRGDPEAEVQPGEVEQLGDDSFFLTASPAMRKVRLQAIQVANVDVPVLLLGESGTGKELVAQLIHKFSSRARCGLLKVNCAALPADLLESELFGYEAGAFTGATRSKPGKFEQCNQGTILLDEIAELSSELQAKLLQVLQDRQFSRLGGRSLIRVDVRILAATNVDIPRALATKKLRSDLYYRLNVITLRLPPLRERREEIPLLLKLFMTRAAERYARAPRPLSPQLVETCLQYPWPGNVRELENFVKRYLILGEEALALSELRPEEGEEGEGGSQFGTCAQPSRGPLDIKSLVRDLKFKAERNAITRAIDQTGGSRKQAARLLNISYRALIYKLRQYRLQD